MAAVPACYGTKGMLNYPKYQNMKLCISSSKEVFIPVHSEQEQHEDNSVVAGGNGAGGGDGSGS